MLKWKQFTDFRLRISNNRLLNRIGVCCLTAMLICAFLLIPANPNIAHAGCNDPGKFTSWHKSGGTWKRALYVRSPGIDKTLKEIKFNGYTMKNSGKGISYRPNTRSNEWQIHHISKTYYWTYVRYLGNWDNDSLWKVCV